MLITEYSLCRRGVRPVSPFPGTIEVSFPDYLKYSENGDNVGQTALETT